VRYILADRPVLALLTIKPAWCLGNALSMVIGGVRLEGLPDREKGAVSIA